MARRIFFKEQSSLGVAPNGYSIMGFNTSNRAIKTDESGVVRLIESVYTDETNTIVIGASGGTGSVSVNGYYQLPNYTPSSGQVLGLSGSSLHWITSGGGGLQGSGTTNYLAKWNSGGLTSSLVYDNGAFVGIGATTVPLASVLLHASKDQASGTSIGISNTNSIGSLGLLFNGNTAGGYTYLSQLNSANTGTRSVNTSLSLSSTFIWAGGDGGTLNPMLIHGDRLVNLNGNNGSGYGFRSDASGFSITRNDATHTPNSSYSSALYVKGSTSESSAYALKVDNSSSSALLYVRNDGFVGVGTSTQVYGEKLRVEGTTYIFGTPTGTLNYALYVDPNTISTGQRKVARIRGAVSGTTSDSGDGLYIDTLFSGLSEARGIYSNSISTGNNNNFGGYFFARNGSVNSYGVAAYAGGGDSITPSGFKSAIYGYVEGTGNTLYGGRFIGINPSTNNSTTYGMHSSVSTPGSTTGTTFVAGYFSAISGANNYAIVVPSGGGNVGIGTTTPVSSALLEMSSTTQGFLPPRMTQTQRTSISSPAIGLIVYQTDGTEGLYINKSGGWTFIV